MSIQQVNESEALSHFEMDRTTEEMLETHLSFDPSPQYPVVLEDYEEKTRSRKGRHYRQAPDSEAEIGELSVEQDEISVEKLSLNPANGEALIEFDEESGEEPRRYRLLGYNDEEIALLAEVGYGERDTAQIKYDKEDEKVKGRRSPEDSWKNYNGVREKYRIKLLEKTLKKYEELQEEPETDFTGLDFNQKVYDEVTAGIERDGQYKIHTNTHVGGDGPRGADLANEFFSATVRHPEDSPDNYQESEGKGKSTIIITKA